MHRNNRGISLMEVAITIVITGIVVFAAGELLLQSQSHWQRGMANVQQNGDVRACRLQMEYILRNSSGAYTPVNITTPRKLTFTSATGVAQAFLWENGTLSYSNNGSVSTLLTGVTDASFSVDGTHDNMVTVSLTRGTPPIVDVTTFTVTSRITR